MPDITLAKNDLGEGGPVVPRVPIMSQSQDRPIDTGATDGSKDSDGGDGRGKFPSRGFAGKLRAARNAAPEGATDKKIQNVAWVALERQVHPMDVWEGDG